MSEPKSRVTTFVIDEDRDAKIDAIVAHLRAELGVGVSRSGAIRLMIDRFSLPDWSSSRPMITEEIKNAA